MSARVRGTPAGTAAGIITVTVRGAMIGGRGTAAIRVAGGATTGECGTAAIRIRVAGGATTGNDGAPQPRSWNSLAR